MDKHLSLQSFNKKVQSARLMLRCIQHLAAKSGAWKCEKQMENFFIEYIAPPVAIPLSTSGVMCHRNLK